MKRTISLLFFVCFMIYSFSTEAQTNTNRDKAVIAERIDSLLLAYIDLSTITKRVQNEKTDSKSLSKRIKEFKSLFEKEAIVFDDINAKFVENPAKGQEPYQLEEKTIVDYAAGLVDEFPTGLIISNNRININYDNFDLGYVYVALDRTISGVSYTNKYILTNKDTLKITLKIKDNSQVKISRIEAIASHLYVQNDKDKDGVIDGNDECEDVKGKISLNGCPDSDNDGIIDKNDYCPDEVGPLSNNGCPPSTFSYRYVFSGSAGYGVSRTSLTMGEMKDTGYENYKNGVADERENANAGTIEAPSFEGSKNLNALIGAYFGKTKGNRNRGISLGIMWTNYNATYSLKNVRYFYQEVDKDGKIFERRISLKNGSTETINFNYLSFPLLFKYKNKFNFNPKIAWEIGIGPSFLFSTAKIKTVSNSFDFEGVYQRDSGQYVYHANRNSAVGVNINDVRLVASEIEAKKGNADALFESLSANGYDYAREKTIDEGEKKSIQRFNVALNATGDIFYHISAKMAIKLGAACFYTPFNNNKKGEANYIMIKGNSQSDDIKERDNGSAGKYYSITNSKLNKISFASYGINLGIIIGIN